MKITLERKRVIKELVEYEVHGCHDCPNFQIALVGDPKDWQRIFYRCFCNAAPLDDNLVRILQKMPTKARLKEYFSAIPRGCPCREK